jgi:hypothetical protein
MPRRHRRAKTDRIDGETLIRRQRLDEVRTGDGCPLSKHLKAEICRELDRLELLLTKAELARIFGLGKRRRWPWNGFRAELARQELLPDGTRPCVPIPRRKWRAHTGRTSALQFRGPFPTCVNDGYDHNCEIGRNSVRAMQ